MNIAIEKVVRVEQLLEQGGLSFSAIAETCGVRTSVVQIIAGGAMSSVDLLRRQQEVSTTVGRCRTCGAQAYLPCYACAIAAWRRGEAPEPAIRPPECQPR